MTHKKITFSNGLRLVLAPQKASLAATVLVLVETGSEYETKKINGISHFLEHMMFKGTTRRPTPAIIAAELASLGGVSNAFTSQEYTGYYAKVQSSKVGQAIDIVTDLYLNPLFNQPEIDRERGVVIEEINMYEDTPMRKVNDLFMGLLYGDQPAGWDIAGPKENIRTITRKDFLAYRAKHYVAPKTVVVIGGNFNEQHVVKQVKAIFGHLPRAKVVKKDKTKEKQSRPAVFLKHKKSDQTHLILGVRAFNLFDKRRYALQVLADILGGGMSSRLFQHVREQLGAAYYVNAQPDLYLDHGYFAVSAGSDHKKINEVLKAILEEFERIKREPVPKEELQRSKDHLMGSIVLGLETSDDIAGYYGQQEVLARSLVDPDTLMAKIKAVTADEVQHLARELLITSQLNLTMIGPYKNATPFKKILKVG
jgi:predicted Zn-dependent peptidase